MYCFWFFPRFRMVYLGAGACAVDHIALRGRRKHTDNHIWAFPAHFATLCSVLPSGHPSFYKWYSPVVAAELSLLHVTVLDSGFATLCFHKCALMVNNFIEFAHFCQYIFLDKMLNCQLQHHFCKFCFIYC